MAVKSDQALTFRKLSTCSKRDIGTHSNSSSFNIDPKERGGKKEFRDKVLKGILSNAGPT